MASFLIVVSTIALQAAAVPVAPSAAPSAAPLPPPPSAPAPKTGRVLTLDQALRAAEARQPDLRRAANAVELASAKADEARAPLLPQANANAGYTRQTGNSYPRPGVASVQQKAATFDTYGTFNFGLNVNQLIYDFGQTSGRWQAAKAGIDVQRETEATVRVQAVLGVRSAFFAARAQKALLAVARDTLANQDRHLAQVQAFVEIGTRPAIDLAQARTDRANAELSLVNSENAYDVAKARLNLAMGVPGETNYDVADEPMSAVDGEDAPTDALLTRAIAARPELRSLARQQEAQELSLRAVKGAYGPTLAASTGVTAGGTDLTALAPNWNAGITLTWPIFQGLQTSAQVREASANLRDVALQLESQRLQIRLDLDQARLAVRAAKGAIRASGDALANARERLRLAEGRYQAGAGNIIELGDAQIAQSSAAAQVVQADYNLGAARAQLLAALGQP